MFPLSFPKIIELPLNNSDIIDISSNKLSYTLILTNECILLYGCKRDDNIIGCLLLNEFIGIPKNIIWNNDHEHFAILTTKELCIYRVNYLSIVDININTNWTTTASIYAEQLPSVTFTHIKTVSYENSLAMNDNLLNLCCLNNIMFICSENGRIHVVSWRGRVAADVLKDKLNKPIICIKSNNQHSIIGIICNNSVIIYKYIRSELIPIGHLNVNNNIINDIEFNNNFLNFTIALENKIYQYDLKLLLEDMNNTELYTNNIIECNDRINKISWSHDNKYISVLCNDGHIEIFTYSGVRVYNSEIFNIKSAGFLLWAIGDFHLYRITNNNITNKLILCRYDLYKSMDNMLLMSSERMILWNGQQGSSSIDSDWDQITLSAEYLRNNWPITKSKISKSLKHIIIIGTCGFAIYDRLLNQWKCFQNLAHEKQIKCQDVCWINDEYILVVNIGHQQLSRKKKKNEQQSELLLYKYNELSNEKILIQYALPTSLLLLNVENHNILLHLIDGTFMILDLLFDPFSIQCRYKLKSSFITKPLQSMLWRSYNDHHNIFELYYLILEQNGTLLKIKLPKNISSNNNNNNNNVTNNNNNNNNNEHELDMNNIKLITGNIYQFWLSPILTLTKCNIHTAHVFRSYESKESDESKIHWNYIKNLISISNRKVHVDRLFTFNKDGVHIWMPYCSSGKQMNPYECIQMPSNNSDMIALKIEDFDIDILPLGIDCNIGVLVRATMSNVTSFLGQRDRNDLKIYLDSCAFPRLESRLKPYLPPILAYLIICHCDTSHKEITLQVITNCRWHSLFDTSLELLLHECLQWNTKNLQLSDQLLHHILSTLRQLPEYLSILVNTARKIDYRQWGRLFSLTQSPTDLLLQCLNSQQYETASHYLLLVQRTEGVRRARQMAVKILNESITSTNGLNDENIELTRALTLFLQEHTAQLEQ